MQLLEPKLNIAQISPRYFPYIGGVETVVRELSEHFAKRGHLVTVYTTDPLGTLDSVEEINGVSIRRFKSWAPSDAYFISMSLRRSLKEELNRYDIVHAHSYHAIPALYALHSHPKYFFFSGHYHGGGHTPIRKVLHIPYKVIAKKLFTNAERVFCVSHFEKTIVERDFPKSLGKIIVIPNGVNQTLSKAKPFTKKAKIILYVGRLERYKNVHRLLGAIPFLPVTDRVVIIGKGPAYKTLRKQAEKLNIEDRVDFLTDVDDQIVHRWLKTCDLFVTLSQKEAFGITVLEALAAGKRVLVNNSAALQYFSQEFNSVFGIDLQQLSDKKLASVIQSQINKSFIAQKEIQNYNWTTIADKVLSTYYEVLYENK